MTQIVPTYSSGLRSAARRPSSFESTSTASRRKRSADTREARSSPETSTVSLSAELVVTLARDGERGGDDVVFVSIVRLVVGRGALAARAADALAPAVAFLLP